MSTKSANPSIVRVENSFKQLAAAAQALSSASDDLGKVIRHLDAALKKLALGIAVWVQVNGTSDETQYWASEIGYVKLDGKWCIALREVTGYLQDNSDESEQVWEFSEAPRTLRTEAVDKIPDLLDKMLQQTQEATKAMQEKTEQAAELTFLVSNLVPNPPAPAPQTWHRPAAGDNLSTPKSEFGPQSKSSTLGDRSSTPAATSAGTTPAAPNGRFREVENTPAERAGGQTRVLPAERVS